MVTADPSVQLQLLDLQAIDTILAQLSHRRAALPELAVIREADQALAALHGDVVGLETELSDIASEQRRMENDIDVVRTRERRDQQRLSSGGIPAKELESLQHELVSLARRQATLEDQTLEVMEKREELESALAAVAIKRDAATERRAVAIESRDAALADIDAQIAAKKAARGPIVAVIPEDLIGVYDKVRAAQGGVGAAMLRHRRCEGCRIELSGSELSSARQAAPEDVLRCENCRRILVRTVESGL